MELAKLEPLTFRPPLCCLRGDVHALELMSRLGGTIKIAREVAGPTTYNNLPQKLAELLTDTYGKIVFGLSAHPISTPLRRNDLETLGKNVKKLLKDAGKSVRFIPNKELTLSSATVVHNNLVEKGAEFLLIETSAGFVIARTMAVQDFESFSLRDFGRPAFDSKSGMLPPKLALMMLNLANVPTGATILDPFCGSGTVLMEALLQKYAVIGSDLSTKAVHDSKQNIAWLQEKFAIANVKCAISEQDVKHLTQKVGAGSVDAVVTEPYLGEPRHGNESATDLQKRTQELADLYSDAFEQFTQILKPGGAVVIALPRFRFKGEWIRLPENLWKKIAALGFVPERLLPTKFTVESFLLYHRPDQHVGREIWKFRLSKTK